MEVTGTSEAHQCARKLRRELTKPERLLWWALRGDKTGFHLERWGILSLRVPARDVLDNLQGVIDLIAETARARPLRQR